MVDREIMTWTEEEIAAAFAAAVQQDDVRALSVMELCQALGRGEQWVRRRLRVLLQRGEWETVAVPRESMNGVTVTRMAYRPRGRV